MDHTRRLKSLLAERSLQTGDFTLASGARSNYYVDARRTTMTAEGQFLTGHVCLDAVLKSGWMAKAVGGLTMGADPVAYAIAHRSWIEGVPLEAFSVRKEPKEHGLGQRVEGGVETGTPVIVVEDSFTTGRSALRAVEALQEIGVRVVGVLCLVDREEGGRERIEAAGFPVVSIFTGKELLEEHEALGSRSARPG
jgi:orotate phosphoribosyltransferase